MLAINKGQDNENRGRSKWHHHKSMGRIDSASPLGPVRLPSRFFSVLGIAYAGASSTQTCEDHTWSARDFFATLAEGGPDAVRDQIRAKIEHKIARAEWAAKRELHEQIGNLKEQIHERIYEAIHGSGGASCAASC